MVIFTSICSNYAHKARTLGESIRAAMPDATFVLCLLEREVPEALKNTALFSDIVLAKDAWEGNFDRFIFKHTIVEASTAVKGQFFNYLMARFQDETAFVYLDPDCYVYSDLSELRALLKEHPIVLCPHLLSPGNISMELSSTAHGVYNLGFLAVNRSDEARRFIAWWASRLYQYCYDDIAHGIFTDQKWIDLAPCFFDTYILKHRGYDFAPWSLKDSVMARENGMISVAGDPLRFIHFSGFGAIAEMCMRDWMRPQDHPFRALYDEYARAHSRNDTDKISGTPWSYARYHSGKAIGENIRRQYRENPDVMLAQEDPFTLSDNQLRVMLKKSKPTLRRRAKKKLAAARRTFRQEGARAVMHKIAALVRRRIPVSRFRK